jgi:phosphoribosylformimino-5-aminoimidazole carboxamide ribotide isomerase
VKLYPAVDILGGNAVRLRRGEFDAKKVYEQDPLSAARGWQEEGARFLHVVDLDGARTGEPVNLEQLRRITSELDVAVQYGGGLRSAEAVDAAVNAGAARVILGTAALTDPSLLRRALDAHGPERVLVSVDARDGRVATAGWTQTTGLTPVQVVERLQASGVEGLVYTNVDRDGMLDGPDLEALRAVAEAVSGPLLYSGGVGKLADLEGLARLRLARLEGVIVGKALYERRFTVAEAETALAA